MLESILIITCNRFGNPMANYRFRVAMFRQEDSRSELEPPNHRIVPARSDGFSQTM